MITVDFNRLNIRPESKILDIGCGGGRHTARAWEFPEILCAGADISHDDLVMCREKLEMHQAFYPPSSSMWALCGADVTDLPFLDQSFDVIICSEVLEHVQEDGDAIAEISRVLKHGGILAVSVPRYWPEKICWRLSHKYCHTKGGHIRIYRKNELIKKITRQKPTGKLKLTGIHYAHSLHVPFWWIKCFADMDEKNPLADIYHRFLVWDIMKKPLVTRLMNGILNPMMGKSLVLYFKKQIN